MRTLNKRTKLKQEMKIKIKLKQFENYRLHLKRQSFGGRSFAGERKINLKQKFFWRKTTFFRSE